MKVFIAGPRAVNSLNKDITDVLSRIIEKHLTVLVGDADGVDKMVQKYFAESKYQNVYIYACNGKARNNIGNWTVKNVEVPSTVKGFDFYSRKDVQMAQDADNGFMIWNGQSKGTLNNIINLTSQSKKTMIYLIPTEKIHCTDNLSDVERMAKSIGFETYTLYRKLCPKSTISTEIVGFEQLSLSELFL